MAHTAEEIRFGEVGFIRHDLGTVRHDLGTFQLDVRLLERLLELFSLCNISSGGEYALQLSISVVEGGGVVRHQGFLAIPRAGSEFVVGDLFSPKHLLDGGAGSLGLREVILK